MCADRQYEQPLTSAVDWYLEGGYGIVVQRTAMIEEVKLPVFAVSLNDMGARRTPNCGAS